MSVAIAALLVIGGMSVALKVQSSRLDAVKAEYAGFKEKVKAAGEVAEAKARAKEAADKSLKEKIDRENKTLRANLADASKRLRDNAAGGGRVPQIAAPAGSPDEATISLAVANRSLREYFEAARGLDIETARIIIEGAEGIADLNSAKSWAKVLPQH